MGKDRSPYKSPAQPSIAASKAAISDACPHGPPNRRHQAVRVGHVVKIQWIGGGDPRNDPDSFDAQHHEDRPTLLAPPLRALTAHALPPHPNGPADPEDPGRRDRRTLAPVPLPRSRPRAVRRRARGPVLPLTDPKHCRRPRSSHGSTRPAGRLLPETDQGQAWHIEPDRE